MLTFQYNFGGFANTGFPGEGVLLQKLEPPQGWWEESCHRESGKVSLGSEKNNMNCLGQEVGVWSGIGPRFWDLWVPNVSWLKSWKHLTATMNAWPVFLMVSWNKMPIEQRQKENQCWAGNHRDSPRGREKEQKVVIFLIEQESIFHPVMIVQTKILIVIKNQRNHWPLGRHHCQVSDLNKWVWFLSVQ